MRQRSAQLTRPAQLNRVCVFIFSWESKVARAFRRLSFCPESGIAAFLSFKATNELTSRVSHHALVHSIALFLSFAHSFFISLSLSLPFARSRSLTRAHSFVRSASKLRFISLLNFGVATSNRHLYY